MFQILKIKTTSNGRQPQNMKFETLDNRIKSECTKVSNEDNLKQMMTSKYEKWNISATSGRILVIGIKPECTNVSNKDNLQWKMTSMTSNYEQWNFSATTC